MTTLALKLLYIRDLDKLLSEIELYDDEESLWKTATGINNSAGNLCLHIIGNLKLYVGKNLLGNEYIRDRPAEFSLKNIPRKKIIEDINSLKLVFENQFIKISTEELSKTYSDNVLGYEMSTAYFLIHLYGHLNFHLGQINYHRRLI